MKIADRLDIAMRAAGFKSQAQLSRASGVKESTLARILKGSVTPNIENLQALSHSMNVSMDWIVNGTTSKNSPELQFNLTYVTPDELRLLTQFREANEIGKKLIISAGDSAPKNELAPSTDNES